MILNMTAVVRAVGRAVFYTSVVEPVLRYLSLKERSVFQIKFLT